MIRRPARERNSSGLLAPITMCRSTPRRFRAIQLLASRLLLRFQGQGQGYRHPPSMAGGLDQASVAMIPIGSPYKLLSLPPNMLPALFRHTFGTFCASTMPLSLLALLAPMFHSRPPLRRVLYRSDCAPFWRNAFLSCFGLCRSTAQDLLLYPWAMSCPRPVSISQLAPDRLASP